MRFTKSLAIIAFVGPLFAGPQAYTAGGDGKPIIDTATRKAMVKAANAGESFDVVAVL